MCKMSEENRCRLGNIMVYIANHADRPCKTKVLKLIYLMEERWVLTTHTPFTGLPFEVWQHGPVEKDVFVDLSEGPTLLSDYVAMRNDGDGTYMEALQNFDEEEFSDNELRMMADVMQMYGSKSASDLVALTHRENSLWYREAKEHGLLEAFKNSRCNSSDVEIDFSKALSPCDAEFYLESLNTHNAANYYGA